LCYLGAIDTRAFHAELVAAVAREHPEWTFVLVGPANRRARRPLAVLRNVHRFEPVPYRDAPAVLRGCDVGLIPYRVGGLIDYVHPKKYYEYLAMGKPVVATPLPALVALDTPMRLATGPAAFATAISAALRASPREAGLGRAVALDNSWQVRGGQLQAHLAQLAASR
jgi:glycosyltransferase involved in cell wall biosynthesis